MQEVVSALALSTGELVERMHEAAAAGSTPQRALLGVARRLLT